MPEHYTMLWNDEYCRFLSKANEVGRPLRFLWGGHNKNTRFSQTRLKVGDYVYPLRVRNQTVFVIARMKVRLITSVAAYLAFNPEDQGLITHDCANEVLIGDSGTPIRFDLSIPAEILNELRFRSPNGERGLKYLESGRLLRSASLEGVYRLSSQSAHDLAALLGFVDA